MVCRELQQIWISTSVSRPNLPHNMQDDEPVVMHDFQYIWWLHAMHFIIQNTFSCPQGDVQAYPDLWSRKRWPLEGPFHMLPPSNAHPHNMHSTDIIVVIMPSGLSDVSHHNSGYLMVKKAAQALMLWHLVMYMTNMKLQWKGLTCTREEEHNIQRCTTGHHKPNNIRLKSMELIFWRQCSLKAKHDYALSWTANMK